MRDEGAIWVVNTGRTLEFALEGLHAHGFKLEPDFLIVEETALLHPRGGDWIALGDWIERRDLAHGTVRHSASEFFSLIRSRVDGMDGAEYLHRDRGPDEIISRDEAQMDEISSLIESERDAWRLPEVGFQRNSIYLRFGHRDFCKGATLAELGRTLGIGPERIFAAGDNHNDLSMLNRDVAHAIACPSNALPVVQDAVRDAEGFVASQPFGHGLLESLFFFFGDG